MNIFRELNSKERTIILITHDMNIASYAGRVLKIVDGKIIEQIIHKTGKEININ